MKNTTTFNISQDPEPHIGRTKEIINKYPEIKQLMGRNPYTFLYILGVVGLQLSIAYFMKDLAWYWILLTAYCVGAFANHALFVLIHECSHNMVFKNRTANILAAILCDFPNAFPSSAGFRKYHLKHHAFQGHYEIDADIPSKWEAKMIGNSFFGKAIWLLFFPIFQLTRPSRLKQVSFQNKWIWFNILPVLAVDVAIVYFWGPWSLVYLMASFFFSVGLHPLGGRWVQEHYLVNPDQETYSYYGPLNILAFNVGYHNEHHDFAFVPWNNLPKIKAIAPEYYDTLDSHTSWSKLVWYFLTEGHMSLFSRTVRDNKGQFAVSADDESDFFEGREKREAILAH